MTIDQDPSENDLLKPVLRLYPRREFRRLLEVPLGQKKVDLVCMPRNCDSPRVCIELKVKNWKAALWQANLNRQIADESYIAIWHRYSHRVQEDLLEHYGVGLIAVYRTKATVLARPSRARRIGLCQGAGRPPEELVEA